MKYGFYQWIYQDEDQEKVWYLCLVLYIISVSASAIIFGFTFDDDEFFRLHWTKVILAFAAVYLIGIFILFSKKDAMIRFFHRYHKSVALPTKWKKSFHAKGELTDITPRGEGKGTSFFVDEMCADDVFIVVHSDRVKIVYHEEPRIMVEATVYPSCEAEPPHYFANKSAFLDDVVIKMPVVPERITSGIKSFVLVWAELQQK